MNKEALIKAIKEPLRLLAVALIPFLISYFVGLPYEWAALTTLVLRGVDKYLHYLAPKGTAGGLVRF